jgi:serine/threonine-protein kinase
MTDLRDQLQSSLGAAYTLERELGGGGMSRVFVATETALGRHVVVKVLPPEMAAAVSTERFRREISVAARLQHPHIVPLLSAGQMEGIPYFTMPLIEGESLRVRLARKGELPVSEAIRILREIASALAYAHERGVVHRDIKPDNVMMSGDVAMVTDFGVAKALSASSNADHGGVTSLGVALGTPAYMSPEQATADPTIDHRSDIYAFGVLAYEILSGQPPFIGRNPSQLLAAQVQEGPDPIAKRRPNLPPRLAALVMRCLEKRPADRPQSAADIVHALDDITTPSGGMQPTSAGLRAATPAPAGSGAAAARSTMRAPGPIVLGIVVLALGIGAFLVWRRGPVAGEAGAGPKRVAVLPFENLGDTSEAYFADGITDEIRGKLASLPSMQVTASGSASQYRGSAKTPQEIGKELGVEYLLVGKIRWVKNPGGKSRVRVSPELVQVANVSSPTTRWQQPFDAEITDVFQVQGDIAGQVANALGVALGAGDQKHLSERPTENLAAYDAYLKAEGITGQMTSNDPPTLRRAIESYEQAVALDTSFAPAWAQLSRALSSLYANGTPSPDLASGALRAAQHAVAVAPNRPEGRLATAEYFRLVGKDARRAADEAEQGRRLAPTNVDLMVATALAKQESGSWDESQALLEKAFALDPRSVQTAYRLARTLLYRRRYSEALPASDRVLALSPTNLSAIEGKAMSYLGQGNLAAARNVLHTEG